MKTKSILLAFALLMASISPSLAQTNSQALKDNVYQPGQLKPLDSVLTLKVGDRAPDFTLPAVSGEKVTLSQYLGKNNVVISFVPAAWTPICSEQWPDYIISKGLFDRNDAVLLGVTVDNIPTLFAWTNQMGKPWFPVLSDFYPHGKVANLYGVLRSSGTTERALFVIDKQGVIRYIDVHDINKLPQMEHLMTELQKLR